MSSILQLKHYALVGAPNSGKSSLFNWLTGHSQRVVNYPGSTVDVATGTSRDIYGEPFTVTDTPGLYSLSSRTADEEITYNLLNNSVQGQGSVFDKIVFVIDATQLERQLPLFLKVQKWGHSCVIALTMLDLLWPHPSSKTATEVNKLVEELQMQLKVPVVAIHGRWGGGVKELIQALRQDTFDLRLENKPSPYSSDDFKKEVQKIIPASTEALERTKKIDQILLHPYWGLIFFVFVMFSFFWSLYSLAAPFMELVDRSSQFLSVWVMTHVSHPLLASLIGEGLISGFGAVLVFVPQIFILFIGVGVLEESGYLARASVLIDKPLSKVGLSGQSFVPLLSGFACAIPALLATRSIESKKAKWLTAFVIPLMTCSARLPIYTLLIGFLFSHSLLFASIVMTGLYVAGIVFALIISAVLSRFLKFQDRYFLAQELPYYRRPSFKTVMGQSVRRTKHYVTRSGPIIFLFAILVWLGTTFPNYSEEPQNRVATSYAASVGQKIEPLFEPLGVDWRVGVSLISAFAAREVFVSTLAILFNVTDLDSEEDAQKSLLASMQEARWPDGRALFTGASTAALLIFFILALQCTTTTAVALREFSKGLAFSQLIIFNALAYFLAVLVYQILS